MGAWRLRQDRAWTGAWLPRSKDSAYITAAQAARHTSLCWAKRGHVGPWNLLVLECDVYFLSSDDSFNCRTLSCRVLLVHVQVSLNLVAILWNRFFCCCVSQ